ARGLLARCAAPGRRAVLRRPGLAHRPHLRRRGQERPTDDLAKRPQFRAMLADAEAGLVDVVLVHKLDRFARNLRVTLETLDRLERCRVAFASIAENMDFTSPIGKVILATLAAFAQYYSDNLSCETRKGK